MITKKTLKPYNGLKRVIPPPPPPPKITLMGSHGKWDDCDITFIITMIIKQRRIKCIECTNKKDELYDVPIYCMKFLKYDPF